MEGGEQAAGQTIKQHGESVWQHTKRLILGDFDGFVLPEWFRTNHHFIVNNLHNWATIREYNEMHDCGKPFCLEIDADGKRHFPNHAEVSKRTYLEVFPERTEVAELIGLDMLLHTCRLDEILNLKLSNQTLMTLLITSFGELHSNAAMFGGTDSTSFKIKYKKLDKLGRKLVEQIPKHQDVYSYIVVRRDIPVSQQLVQSCHAVWEGAKHEHPSLVALVVKNEAKLKKTMELLIDNNVQFTAFREPLLGNTLTAICTEPLAGEKRGILSRYMLWNEN